MVVFVLIDKILATWRTVFVHPFPLSSTFAKKATKNWMTIWWLLYLVSTAGLLFRHFVICYSGPSYYRMFSRAYNNRNGQEHISIDVQMELIDKLAVRFYGYCLLALNNISKKTVKEAFYMWLWWVTTMACRGKVWIFTVDSDISAVFAHSIIWRRHLLEQWIAVSGQYIWVDCV